MTFGKKRLVADGTDGIDGRALLLISALYHGATALVGREITFLGTRDPAVQTAIEALHWDTGLDVTWTPEGRNAEALSGAGLFTAVAFRDTAHLPLATVAALEVPMLIAIQFPDPARHGAAVFALQRAAHDPERLAAAILARVEAV